MKGDHAVVDVEGEGGGPPHERAFVDFRRKTVLRSVPGRSAEETIVLPQLGEAPPGVRVTRTDQWREVAGQRCELWILADESERIEVCVMKGVPWIDPHRILSRPVPPWSRWLEASPAFPLSVERRDPRGRVAFAMRATEVDRRPVGR